MSCILSIETNTGVYPVAVDQDGACIFEREGHNGPNHTVELGTYVDEVLLFIGSHLTPPDGVAVSYESGSYIGPRIGVSMAKSICHGRSVKLISVPTLKLLCVPVLLNKQIQEEDASLCPMLNAHRVEVYMQLFDRSLRGTQSIQTDVIDHETYRSYLDRHLIYFFGNGAEKCLEATNHSNAHLIKGVGLLTKNMFPLTEKHVMNEQFEDMAYFVPFYLGDFVAKSPKKLP